MSKHIIELNEDCKIVQQMCVTEHGNAYTDGCYSCDLEELNFDYINEHYGQLQDEAYNRGYEDGRKVGIKDGMCEAWEAARKIVVDTDHGGIALGTLGEIFGTQGYSYIMRENTAQEAIDKIKAYEDKQKADDEIKVGDEVVTKTGKKYTVVAFVDSGNACGFNANGMWTGWNPKDVTKTGKHYDIASILEAMQND